MKRIFLLIVPVIFQLPVCSQESNTYTDSIIYYTYTSPSDSALLSKRIYAYNSNEDQTLDASYYWSTDHWYGNIKEERKYANGNLTKETQFLWDIIATDWKVVGKVEFTNDVAYWWDAEAGNVTSNPSDNTAEIQWGASGEGVVYVVAENQYECKSDTAELQVTIGSTGIITNQINEIKIYPNPTRDMLYVSTALVNIQVEILDFSGREILITGRRKIDLSHLSGGAYLVRIKDPKGLSVKQKLILKE
jgi:hypothetical protein